ncbi:hypothetical protein [Leisingera sp. M523]|uniref:phage adaptor protein n=1 Tax=Leisingera sp. M523 TaxID=2867013 RepID=UPI0021A437AE|nr:hypothetical protein [Leisingera sp. M523]UWQ30259.1 hypothetical protein K3557_06900 [Leisingera sp. M523]
MSTYLQLCQDAARESGTVSNIGQPETTENQTGRLLRILKWVTKAYEDIQRSQNAWRWMHADFSAETVAAVQQYDAEAMGINERFSRWVVHDDDGDNQFSIYKTSEGQVTEGFLNFVDWAWFRRNLMTGGQASKQDKPYYFSIDNENKLRLWPTPDAAYTVRGVYYKAPQSLAADADTPEMPAEFHDVIVWRALMLLGQFDEAFNQIGGWNAEYTRIMGELRLHQLPRIQVRSTLA